MYLRYFVVADDSPGGKLALSYLPALIRIAPVRIADPRVPIFSLQGGWARYGRCLETPMVGPFVNVVCVPPDRWCWTQRIAAPVKNRHIAIAEDDEDEGVVEDEETEQITGVVELYTAVGPRTQCLRNVLISDLSAAQFADLPLELRDTATKYEAIVTGPVTDHAAFRKTIRGD